MSSKELRSVVSVGFPGHDLAPPTSWLIHSLFLSAGLKEHSPVLFFLSFFLNFKYWVLSRVMRENFTDPQADKYNAILQISHPQGSRVGSAVNTNCSSEDPDSIPSSHMAVYNCLYLQLQGNRQPHTDVHQCIWKKINYLKKKQVSHPKSYLHICQNKQWAQKEILYKSVCIPFRLKYCHLHFTCKSIYLNLDSELANTCVCNYLK